MKESDFETFLCIHLEESR